MNKILLVEDDEEIAAAVKAWLQMRKFVIKAVSTGEEAIEQLKFGQFDAILLDWQLPDMEGTDICRQFRKDGGTIPVLMMSGNSTEHERETGLAAGANEYFVKPFNFEQLSVKLKELIENYKQATNER
jgi:DNA-binding response OmpR family regulator